MGDALIYGNVHTTVRFGLRHPTNGWDISSLQFVGHPGHPASARLDTLEEILLHSVSAYCSII